ncbi:MAG TPA: trypsin-like peptidase domain-containing protein [Nitrospiria bacterium]|jgi:serine protease Do|nr:trypsin-like peptidase domain-containing protein [Nitrospiria bacterium]
MKRNHRVAIGVLLLAAAGFSARAAGAYTPKEIYESVGPGVVLILASDDGRMGMGGTGSILRADGLVITNAHVVINKETGRPYRRLSLFLKPDRVTGNMDRDLARRVEAKLVAYDASLDMALLRMENPPAGLTVVPLGNPDDVSIGDPVVAIGHPETGGLWTLTTGTISAEMEDFNGVKGKDIFQTETSLNRGNSGGPLLDGAGAMVGVNTMISRKAADGLTITSINFALKSSVAQHWLASQGVSVAYASGSKPPGESSGTPPRAVESAGTPAPSSPPVMEKPVTPVRKPAGEAASPPPGATPPAKDEKPAPKVLTEKRPYDLDRLIADQMKEMEDLMEEMHKKFR